MYYFVPVLSDFLKTGPGGFVVCILWFSFFCCCVYNFGFCFSFLSKNDQKRTQQNSQKQKCRKKQTFFSVSAAVFTNSVPFLGWVLNMQIFAENAIKLVVSACFEKKGKNLQNAHKCQTCWVKTWSKVESKLGPRLFRNIMDQISTQKMVLFVVVILSWKSYSPWRKKKIN